MTDERRASASTRTSLFARLTRASLALVLVAAGCEPGAAPRQAASPSSAPIPETAPDVKAPAPIEIDLATIDADGLRGPADGKVAVDYEFTIVDSPEARARVQAIDASVEFLPGSRGRIGAGAGECLCIGSTHQANWRAVLESLAALPGVERIIECHRE